MHKINIMFKILFTAIPLSFWLLLGIDYVTNTFTRYYAKHIGLYQLRKNITTEILAFLRKLRDINVKIILGFATTH